MSDRAKILIADDEPDCIDFVREALADGPYDVVSASDGEEALNVARAEAPNLIGSKAGDWDTNPEHWDELVDRWGDAIEK